MYENKLQSLKHYGFINLNTECAVSFQAGSTADVCKDLEEKISHELEKVRRPIEDAYMTLDKCLSEGVKNSESSCDKVLKSILQPVCISNIVTSKQLILFLYQYANCLSVLFQRGVKGSAVHKTLKCVVENGGVHTPKKKKPINLNVKLASYLTNSIDEEFKKTFP